MCILFTLTMSCCYTSRCTGKFLFEEKQGKWIFLLILPLRKYPTKSPAMRRRKYPIPKSKNHISCCWHVPCCWYENPQKIWKKKKSSRKGNWKDIVSDAVGAGNDQSCYLNRNIQRRCQMRNVINWAHLYPFRYLDWPIFAQAFVRIYWF